MKKVNWRNPARHKDANEASEKNEEELALDKEAAAAIVKDLEKARTFAEDDDDHNVIPQLLQNRPPTDWDSTDSAVADIEMRPDESTTEDYENMPISQFGTALLRGMGWKKSEGIGRTNKCKVEPIEYVQRPAGQGLGAIKKIEDASRRRKPGEEQRKGMQPIREKNGKVRWVKTLDEEVPEQLEGFVAGVNVSVTSGPHKGLLGKVIDVESSGTTNSEQHINVKLILNKQVLRFSEHHLKLLTDEEFHQLKQESAKKSRMQKYGLISMKPGENSTNDDDVICMDDVTQDTSTISHSVPTLDQPSNPIHDESSKYTVKDTTKSHKHKKRKHHQIEETDSSGHAHKKHHTSRHTNYWLAPNLRVRIISKDYHNGVHYNKKVNIIDVSSLDSCMCRTDDGKLLEDLHQDCLETVIPKEKGADVIVVTGKHKHKLASILDRNSSKSEVTVQLENSKKVLTLTYDDVCQCTAISFNLE
ncbi:G-patch domain and KOW motifs-containing protein-like isoform X2 [Dysidea avara]|uniref:G-patch domain and KOW motifs-containing protein-like isoform X2 n=1 Tax=Dysidea avara TaxID=196820 RepID=UPI003332DA71